MLYRGKDGSLHGAVYFKILCHRLHIGGGELAQRQQQTGQRFLRQGGKLGALVLRGVHGRAHGVYTVCAKLHPGVVPRGDVLDAQFIGGGEQGCKPGIVAGTQYLGGLAGQGLGL